MDNTKLIAEAERLIAFLGDTDGGPALRGLLTALEAAEAELRRERRALDHASQRVLELHGELTRRDTVIAAIREWEAGNGAGGYLDDDESRELAAILAAAPVSLEAVKAETTTQWSIDRADGYPPEVMDERKARRLSKAWHYPLVQREVTKWRPFETEGDNRG